jgi:hypothetical protein
MLSLSLALSRSCGSEKDMFLRPLRKACAACIHAVSKTVLKVFLLAACTKYNYLLT